ncbi:DUF948 domain-containing protein [Lentibacillus lipolyticus]|nr:DUF948 domain-containing protein [Lentibacillus lipolyticus]
MLILSYCEERSNDKVDLVGIGILLIGLASIAVAVLLIKPLKKLTNILTSLQVTTGQLPEQVAGIMMDTSNVLRSGTAAISQINQKIGRLDPIIQLAGDIGKAVQNLTASVTAINKEMKAKTDNTVMKRYNLEWIYGIAALGYCIRQRKNN